MALNRIERICDVVDRLELAPPGRSPQLEASAIPKARAWLGVEPMAWLFTRCADAWVHTSTRTHAWRGLAVYGVDGSTLRVADSAENRAHFGGELEMERIADELRLPPTRISFVTALTRVVDTWSWIAIASPGTIPKHLLDLRRRIKRLILPPRRPNRSYPRAVKIKTSNYPRNRRLPSRAPLE